MGSGQMIGEEDVIKERTYTMSARCFSTCAKLYYMKTEDFHRQIKTLHEETWNVMMSKAVFKELHLFKAKR